MKRTLLTPRRVLVLVVGLLVVCSLLPQRLAGRLSAGPREVVALVSTPVTAPLKSLSNALRTPAVPELVGIDQEHPGHTYRYLRHLERENERLREEIRALQRVREVVGRERPIRLINARVGSAAVDGRQPTLTIDRGRRHGLAVGQVVVWGFSLVGRIERAGPNTSDVRLFTAESGVEVRIVPPEADPPRQMEHWLDLARRENGHYLLPELPHEAPVAEGDLVHLAEPRWPREAQGFILGQIASLRDDESDPLAYQQALVRPALPLTELNWVTVLVPGE